MIPEGWREATAEELCSRISVGIVIKPTQYYVDEEQGVRAFRSANIGEGFVRDSEWIHISEDGHAKNKKSALKANDILIVRTGYPGTACLLPPEYEGSNCIDIIFARPDPEQVVPAYLCTFTNSEYGKKQVLDGSGGLAQQHFNVGAYKKLKLPLPPLFEQRRIAETLETWDRASETVEALIANARAQKQALMQQLLTGKRRLPGFDLPWKERALESIFQFKKGQGLSKGAVIPEGVRPCILYGELYTRYPEVIREVVSRTNANDGFPSKSGDVLIPASTTTTGIDLANATAILESDVLLSGDINILRPKNTKQSAPFFAYLLTHILKHKIASRAQGITIVHLYGAHLKPLTVTVPDVEEQHAIASIIMDADDEILRLEAQLTALRQEKAALMQQLLTGKRRVKLPESEVA